RGQHIGLISNNFGGSSTTHHLHFELHQVLDDYGDTAVPTYEALIAAYEDLLGIEAQPCQLIGAEGGVLDDAGPCLALYGPPATWRTVTNDGYEDQLHWTNAWVSDSPGNWARWTLEFAEAGSYRVEMYLTPAYAKSLQVPM